ncbi:hypothetical protein K474DRAFT_1592617 [Panus rudis PR-1116 ss-1]|nr:hypothetical protein K474DRAFT_1592617 [Panus rudis PR-1116 ss-1]
MLLRTFVNLGLTTLCYVVLWPLLWNPSVYARLFNRIVLADPPRNSTGLTDAVQWDNYTLFVHGQRIFLHAGEFHAFRLPVPDLWLDIFQKLVAAGYNGVSMYNHWGLSNPSPGVIDFNDWRALQPLFDAAKLAGIWIHWRPGQECALTFVQVNAELSAGGLAHWSTSLVSSPVRTNATDFRDAWTPYIEAMADVVERNQITNGGPIIRDIAIDNEYSQLPIEHAEYFVQLEELYRKKGIVIPFTYNDPGQHENFINGTGAVDLYGSDAYPQRYDCAHPDVWHPLQLNYHQYHEAVNPSQPWIIPEFQGGSPDGWGGVGYDGCEVLTGPEFEDVFYKENWASNAKFLSYYMTYGGTSWGGMPWSGVYTSYDYGAAIRENRALTSKYDEMKRQNFFIRSSPQFRKTDWIGDSSTGIPNAVVNGPQAFVTLLENSDSGTRFYIARQNDSTSKDHIEFALKIYNSAGTLTLPQTFSSIAINGRQSKVIVTGYAFGANSHLSYSTAAIFFAGKIGERDILCLTGDADQSHEFSLNISGKNGIRTSQSNVRFTSKQGSIITTIHPGERGLTTIWESDGQLILFSDPVTAATFWSPVLPAASGDFKSYWQFGSNATVLIGGPYLVRNATVSQAGELVLRGDLNASAALTVIAPDSVKSVLWNGAHVPVRFATIAGHTSKVIRTGNLILGDASKKITVPILSDWKFKDSLPEITKGYNDSSWVDADHTTTNLTVTNETVNPIYGDGRILFGMFESLCENIVLWRGHFRGTDLTTSANLSIIGGNSSASSVWINEHFINSSTPVGPQTDLVYTFPTGSVRKEEDNVITVIQDNTGNEEGDNAKSPRGIAGFKLNDGNFTAWNVQGKYGGYLNFPDKTRGVMNEGGLFGEREGWHLPGFDTSKWASRQLSAGLPNKKAGAGFFVTTFNLSIPEGHDVHLSFQFDEVTQPYRAILFVNGWHFGKRAANRGPQSKFPVHQGILDYNGKNTVAVALWSLEDSQVSPTLRLVVDNVLEGGVGHVATNNPLWVRRS